ncbi:MAG: hypothetical protein LC136_09170 [Burkholderiales bacterium]|nr:hypothetical protein [Burkholderiales bacterium]
MPKPKPSNETALVRQCLEVLRLYRVTAWRMNVGAVKATYAGRDRFVRFGVPGMSDIIGLMRPSGRLVAIECKVGRRRETPEQAAFQRDVRQAGGLAWTIRSVDELVERLKQE